MKYKAKADEHFRSQLERNIAQALTEEGIAFWYEPFAIPLLLPFECDFNIIEETKKTNKVRGMTYTPDFVGSNWIMEAKGMKTPDFMIKWKLLKRWLKENDSKASLFLVRNLTHLRHAMEIIKNEPIRKKKSIPLTIGEFLQSSKNEKKVRRARTV